MKEELDTLYLRLRAGAIKRYHTYPLVGGQDVGNHSYGVAQLVRYLTDDNCSKSLLCAALDHDVAELICGDSPHAAKIGSPELKAALDSIEHRVEEEFGLGYMLTKEEKDTLKTADLFEAGFFGLAQRDLGNRGGAAIVAAVVTALDKLPMTLNGTYLQRVMEEALNEF